MRLKFLIFVSGIITSSACLSSNALNQDELRQLDELFVAYQIRTLDHDHFVEPEGEPARFGKFRAAKLREVALAIQEVKLASDEGDFKNASRHLAELLNTTSQFYRYEKADPFDELAQKALGIRK